MAQSQYDSVGSTAFPPNGQGDNASRHHRSIEDLGSEMPPSAHSLELDEKDASVLDALAPTKPGPAAPQPVAKKGWWPFKRQTPAANDDGSGDENANKDETPADPPVSFFGLFQFATKFDYLLLTTGTIGAAVAGVALPLMVIVFGDILQSFAEYGLVAKDDPDRAANMLNDAVYDMLQWFGILAASTFAGVYVQIFSFSLSAERQTRRMRELYYEAILRQEIAWFDQVSTGDLTSRISGDVNMIQDGMASKLAQVIQHTITFVAGFIVAFVKGWKLALVLLAAFPLIAIAGGLMSMMVASGSKEGLSKYGAAGAIAEEVVSGIRTVMAFGGQEKEAQRYEVKIREALRDGIKKAIVGGLGVGLIMCILFLTYALGFWFGVKQVAERELGPAEMLTVFFALIMGAMSLGMSAPNFTAISSAQGAASKVFTIIARESPIDPL
ncbi:hypothetical protein H4R35_004208, partial [Dimargaris xerosporica]